MTTRQARNSRRRGDVQPEELAIYAVERRINQALRGGDAVCNVEIHTAALWRGRRFKISSTDIEPPSINGVDGSGMIGVTA